MVGSISSPKKAQNSTEYRVKSKSKYREIFTNNSRYIKNSIRDKAVSNEYEKNVYGLDRNQQNTSDLLMNNSSLSDSSFEHYIPQNVYSNKLGKSKDDNNSHKVKK